MKNPKQNRSYISILILLMTLFQNCQSQTKENPKFLGSENGIFDLDKATFNENIETLFFKIQYVSLDRTADKSKAWCTEIKLTIGTLSLILSAFSMSKIIE